jgi:undecaprenyl diphosphate synthase
MKKNIPKSIGLIMDGNRRWAKRFGFLSKDGHKKGKDILKDFLSWSEEVGIEESIVYVFSNENWNRSKTEVSDLMRLLESFLDNESQELYEKGVKTEFIGDFDRVSPHIVEKMKKVEEMTKGCSKQRLILTFSYGGRQEITDAVQRIVDDGVKEVDESVIDRYLWTSGVSDPDLIIRTGGEMRLSNFLPWQSVYSELFFTKTLWPDFTKEEFLKIIDEFSNRERRTGR